MKRGHLAQNAIIVRTAKCDTRFRIGKQAMTSTSTHGDNRQDESESTAMPARSCPKTKGSTTRLIV